MIQVMVLMLAFFHVRFEERRCMTTNGSDMGGHLRYPLEQ
jgi:hypothetical protein